MFTTVMQTELTVCAIELFAQLEKSITHQNFKLLKIFLYIWVAIPFDHK